jgi:sugar phosphate isomerase/epimerase
MIKLGFVSAILADLPFEKVVEFASANRFACVEMMCWPLGKAERRYAGVTHIDVNDLGPERVNKIQNLLAEKGVTVSALGYYPNPLDADREQATFFVEHIKRVVSASAQLGIGVMNTFIGRDPRKNIEDNFKLFKETWPSIIKHAEEQNVKIGIENCPMYFSADEWPAGKNLAYCPAIWRRMFGEIPSDNFGLNYDPSHLLWQHIDYIKPWNEFKDKLFHVHIKDAKLHQDRLDEVGVLATPLEFHTPKLPGLGDVDWGRFFSALTDVAYEGAACVEVEDRAYEGSPKIIKGSLIQSRNYLQQFMMV